jgi:hypothetical protein
MSKTGGLESSEAGVTSLKMLVTGNRRVKTSIDRLWRYLEGSTIGICDWTWLVTGREKEDASSRNLSSWETIVSSFRWSSWSDGGDTGGGGHEWVWLW